MADEKKKVTLAEEKDADKALDEKELSEDEIRVVTGGIMGPHCGMADRCDGEYKLGGAVL